MKGGGICVLATSLTLGSCTAAPHKNHNATYLSREKYETLIKIIMAQKGIKTEESIQQENNFEEHQKIIGLEQEVQNIEETEQNNSPLKQPEFSTQKNTFYDFEGKPYPEEPTNYSRGSQTNSITPAVNTNNIVRFIQNTFGEETLNDLSSSLRYEEILNSLETIPNYEQVIPLLYRGLELQVNDSYFGNLKNDVPSNADKLIALSLIQSINNPKFVELIINLNKQGVVFDITAQNANLIPDLFYRIDDWKKFQDSNKPEIDFSAQPFLELLLNRPDLHIFFENPNLLNEQLNELLSKKTHYILQLGGNFQDGNESWQNYEQLDFLQKLQLHELILSMNWFGMNREATNLINNDLELDYTEIGGSVQIFNNQLQLRPVESVNQRAYPEYTAIPMRIAGLSEDLDVEQVNEITGINRWLTTEDIPYLTNEQINKLLIKVAEEQNKRRNKSYTPTTFYLKNTEQDIGSFHIHALEQNTAQYAGPSGWFPNSAISSDGSLQVGGDLACAIQQLSVNGRHSLNLLITSIDENTFDINLYYAAGANGRPVNVSVGGFNKTN